jgi:hypothetical protein
MTMLPDDASFTPEHIDAQVEQDSIFPETINQTLLADLRTLYAAEAANNDALMRVWRRIEQSSADKSALTSAHDEQSYFKDSRGNNYMEFETKTPESPVSKTAATSRTDDLRPQRHRLWIDVVAVLLLIILVATVFATHTQHQQTAKILPTPTHSAIPQASSTWQNLTQLQYQAPYVTTVPAISPTNPSVVYEATAPAYSSVVLRRTDNGGATWHILPFPLASTANVRTINLFINPHDSQMVYLQIFNLAAQSCPAGTVENISEGGQGCFVQFISTDAGNHWQLESLPYGGYFADYSLGNGQTIRSQGNRLYMMLVCKMFACAHIVTSTDNGLTWSVADGQISTSTINLCDFAVAPTGQTIFAIMTNGTCDGRSTQTLWESTDSGAHWQRNAQLPTGIPESMEVAMGADPTHPLLYLDDAPVSGTVTKGNIPNYLNATTDFAVSSDGGKTWQHAPSQGVPDTLQNLHMIGILSDGSIIGEFASAKDANASYDFNGSTLFRWKAGETAWQQLGNATIGNIIAMVDVQTARQNDKIFLLTVGRINTFGQVFVLQ